MLRGAMVGAGGFAKRQLEAYAKVKNAEISAICDMDEARLKERANQFSIPSRYTRVEEMLDKEKPDFLDIVTRPASHPALVKTAAERGIHVLCQKPFADSMAECKQMVATCKKAKVRLMVNENYRWQAWFRKTKEIIESGEIGEPFAAMVRTASRGAESGFKGGQEYFAEMPLLMLFEMGIHQLDLMRMLFGEAKSIYARMLRVWGLPGEDVVHAIIDFGKPLVTLTDTWAAESVPGFEKGTDPNWKGAFWGGIQVQGTKGTVVVRPEGRLEIHKPEESRVLPFPEDTLMPMSLVATQQHFVDCLESGNEFETNGENYLKTMALVFAGYQSAETGKAVDPAELL